MHLHVLVEKFSLILTNLKKNSKQSSGVLHPNLLNSPECSRSWALILEGRELLRVYSEIGIVKAERSCNSVAHVLAQLGKSGFSGSLSLEAPDCVKELIASDIM
jgi:hypothetical protein